MRHYPGSRRLVGNYCREKNPKVTFGSETDRPELAYSTVPDDPNLVMPIVNEGFEETIDGWDRPAHDPYSFRINSHVWTTPEIVYKFSQYLNVSARHLIGGKSRQRDLMKQAIERWLPHIGRSARRESDDAEWSEVDFVIRTEDLGTGLKKVADARVPRSPRSYGGGDEVLVKNRIRWNENAWILDRDYAWEWAVAASGGLIFLAATITYWIITHTHADYREIMIHELGHTLGLGHSARGSSIMWPTDQNGRSQLGDHDVRAIRSLYPRPYEYGAIHRLDRAQAFARSMFTGGAQPGGAKGTDSFVVDLGAQRNVLAWSIMGFVANGGRFDDDNVSTVDVFAIGGRPDALEVEEKNPARSEYDFAEVNAEREQQLTHEYFWSYQDKYGNLTEDIHYDRHPLRLEFVTTDANQDQVNATAIYYGYAAARGSSVQFRACGHHPYDHELYATGVVLMLPEEDEPGFSLDPGGEPPPPTDPGADVDVTMVPDIQLPPPPKPGFTTPQPPKKPGFTTPPEVPEPGLSGSVAAEVGGVEGCCPDRGGRRPPPKRCQPPRRLPARSATCCAGSDDSSLRRPKGRPEAREREDLDPDGRGAVQPDTGVHTIRAKRRDLR